MTILKGIEVEIPHELMLPQDPRERPFYYYNILTTNTLALDNELVIALEIPLLDVSRKLKVMEAIALPVPYSATKLTAVYDLEFRHFAISTDGRQYVVLTLEDQLNCGRRNTNYCSLTSAIQEANSHTYCTLALYQRDQDKVDKLCKVKVSNKIRLPVARYVSNGEWLVATEKGFNLRKHCVGEKESSIIPVASPYTAVNLESGCRALADVIELPIYFKRRQEYHVLREGRIVSPPKNVKMTELTIWKPVATKRLDLILNLEKLGDIQDKPIEDLVHDLENLEEEERYQFPDNIMLYALVCVIIAVIAIMMYVIYCKRRSILRTMVNKADQRNKQADYEMPLIRSPSTSAGTTATVRVTEKLTKREAPEVPKKRAPKESK